MIEKEASNPVAYCLERACLPSGAACASAGARRCYPWIWLNLVCFDAPLVAASWQWLFAHTFKLEIEHGARVALFLTAWLIYLADRYADAAALDEDEQKSLRQESVVVTELAGSW